MRGVDSDPDLKLIKSNTASDWSSHVTSIFVFFNKCGNFPLSMTGKFRRNIPGTRYYMKV
jgi:hypothetical protein